MAVPGSRETASGEPESKLQTLAQTAGWVSPGGLDGLQETCDWLGTYRERLRMTRHSAQGHDLTSSTRLG